MAIRLKRVSLHKCNTWSHSRLHVPSPLVPSCEHC